MEKTYYKLRLVIASMNEEQPVFLHTWLWILDWVIH